MLVTYLLTIFCFIGGFVKAHGTEVEMIEIDPAKYRIENPQPELKLTFQPVSQPISQPKMQILRDVASDPKIESDNLDYVDDVLFEKNGTKPNY